MRERWLKDGDQNTNSFHNSVKARRSCNIIHTTKNIEGDWLVNTEDVNNEVVSFFKNILSTNGIIELRDFGDIFEVILYLDPEEKNSMLQASIVWRKSSGPFFLWMGIKPLV